MGDDLTSFIVSQKSKLEKERAELSRVGDYNSTSTDRVEKSSMTPKGYNTQDPRGIRDAPSQPKATVNNAEDTGMQLGGYEKVQQKLKEERRQEYIKFLANKNLRSTGKVDHVLNEGGKSPVYGDKEEHLSKSNQKQRDSQSYGTDLKRDTPTPSPRTRRRGKENWDYGHGEDYSDSRGPRRRPVNKNDSYEDLLKIKRAEERRYRGGFDEPDLDADLRHMKLSSRNYKFNSRSDGFLSQRNNDDDSDDEIGYNRRSRRDRRDRSNIESKRVRFYDEEDMDDSQWGKPRRRQMDDYDDDGDFEDIRELSRRRLRRPERRSSAQEERHTRPAAAEDESLRRTKTDSEIRSQSAPLPEGTGIIGGHVESKAMKVKRQEQYRKELDDQMKQREEMKIKEKMARVGVNGDLESEQYRQPSRTPRSTNRVLEKPSLAPGRQDDYDLSPGNYGPSSRPSQHPSLYPNPYDDPYYYYGGLERGAPQGPSAGGTSFRGAGYAASAATRLDDGAFQDLSPRGRGAPSDVPRTRAQRSHEDDPTHQPPGGYSHIAGIGGGGGGEDPDAVALQKKRAAQQAYQEELRRQMEARGKQKEKERQEKERYEKKMEAEIANFNPWGRGGAGAPIRDVSGHLVTDLRQMHHHNQEGKIVSPRDAPPPKEIQFDLPPEINTQNLSPESVHTGPSAGSGASPFGRSDPLKERQPQDDMKMKAKLEYQEFLKKQVEEKEKQKKEELQLIKREEELEEKRMEEQRITMQKEYEQEQEKVKRKEEEVNKRNEELREAQGLKKKEAERKKKEMEEKREAELGRKLDAEIAAKRAAGAGFRTSSPPIPTIRKKLEGPDYTDAARTASPPIPTLAKQQRRQDTPPQLVKQVLPASRQEPVQGSATRGDPDDDVLSQLTALRQQLKNEEQKVQSQIGRTTATTKYSQIGGKRDIDSRRNRRDVGVFERALSNKSGPARRDADHYSAADEFNRIKYEETSSLAEEFRSRFPQPATSDSMLDLQQQEYLREQEDKLSSLRAGMGGPARNPGAHEGPSRPKSKESLLESDSQFIAVDDPGDIPSMSQVDLRPRQPSARERRRWKQLEDMAKDPKPYDAYKPPTPGGFSLNSVTSFNIDDVASKNEERLRRLEFIRKAGGRENPGDPDQVLQQFMNEHRRPLTRASEASLEAETSFEPVVPF